MCAVAVVVAAAVSRYGTTTVSRSPVEKKNFSRVTWRTQHTNAVKTSRSSNFLYVLTWKNLKNDSLLHVEILCDDKKKCFWISSGSKKTMRPRLLICIYTRDLYILLLVMLHLLSFDLKKKYVKSHRFILSLCCFCCYFALHIYSVNSQGGGFVSQPWNYQRWTRISVLLDIWCSVCVQRCCLCAS